MSSPSDPSRLRVSDADRHQVAERLRDAAGEGRIDLDELDQRLDRAYQAKTYADLAPLTADLPWQPPSGHPAVHPGVNPAVTPAGGQAPQASSSGGVPAPVTHHDKSRSVFSGETRKGVWEIGPKHQATSVVGSVELDLRQVRFTARETEIACLALMGTVHVIVNPVTHVVLDGIKAGGEFRQDADQAPPELGPDSPLVRLTGYAVLGDVSVVRKPMPRPKRRFWGRRKET